MLKFIKIPINQTIILLIIFILAIILRIIGPFAKEVLYDHKPFILSGSIFIKNNKQDAGIYNLVAKSLMEGHGYAFNIKEMHALIRSDHKDDHYYVHFEEWKNRFANDNQGYLKHKLVPPMYPIFLAICYSAFGINTLSFFVPQIFLSAFTCVVIFLLARKIFNIQVAVISGLMLALYPDIIFWAYMIRVETLFIFLLALIFWLLANDNKNYLFAFILGALLGITCLTRLTLLFFVPIIVIWKFFFFEASNQRKLIYFMVLCCSFILALSPWAIRNYYVFGSFSILTDEVWSIFHTSHLLPGDDTLGSYGLILFKLISNNPQAFAIESLSKLLKYLSPFTDSMRPLAQLYKGLTWIIVFPVSFVGMLMAIKKYWATSGLMILFIIYYILLHSITYVDAGLVFRYPIQPFLCIFAAYSYCFFYKKYIKRNA